MATILGLLRRIEQLPTAEEEKDLEAEDEIKEVVAILVDGALVRSGFDVADSNKFLTRVDRVLRRSLGVSETAPTDTNVDPAPEPVEGETVDPIEEPGATLDIQLEELEEDDSELPATPKQDDTPKHDEL
jgi:heat shock protein 90kDa beta